ncbi:hypothetical protein Tco_0579971, partial [Tanacetum coccineum]
GEMFPQRHVAGEKVGMLLGKASNVVVKDEFSSPSMLHFIFDFWEISFISFTSSELRFARARDLEAKSSESATP